MSTVQRVKFLWDAAMTINTSATHINNLLKSNLRNTCQKLAGTNKSIPLERFSESQMCERCSLHWHENEFKINYKPQQIQITTTKAKKLLKRLNDKQNGKTEVQMTRKQKIRAKWLLKRAKTNLVMNCEFCQHKTIIGLEKPNKSRRVKRNIPKETAITKLEVPKKKVKKSKPKDKTAGLKIPAQNPKVEEKLPPKPSQFIKKVPQIKQKTKQTTKQKKPQQKNSLLQLAALLKSQDKPSTNKNRLESFLK